MKEPVAHFAQIVGGEPTIVVRGNVRASTREDASADVWTTYLNRTVRCNADFGPAVGTANRFEVGAMFSLDVEKGRARCFGESVVLNDDGVREQRSELLFLLAAHVLAANFEPAKFRAASAVDNRGFHEHAEEAGDC